MYFVKLVFIRSVLLPAMHKVFVLPHFPPEWLAIRVFQIFANLTDYNHIFFHFLDCYWGWIFFSPNVIDLHLYKISRSNFSVQNRIYLLMNLIVDLHHIVKKLSLIIIRNTFSKLIELWNLYFHRAFKFSIFSSIWCLKRNFSLFIKQFSF